MGHPAAVFDLCEFPAGEGTKGRRVMIRWRRFLSCPEGDVMLELVRSSILPHLHITVHDPWTFAFVIMLGLLQTFIAFDSGYLAIQALIDLAPRKRRRQIWLLGASCVAIVVVTVLIGVLTDQTQWKAERRATKAEIDRAELNVRLGARNDSMIPVYGELSSIEAKLGDCDPKQAALLRGQIDSIRRKLEAGQHLTNPSAAKPEPPSPNAMPPVADGGQSAPGSSANTPSTDRASVIRDIEQTKQNLVGIDAQTNMGWMGFIGGPKYAYQQAWARHAQLNHGEIGPLDSDTQHELDREWQEQEIPRIRSLIAQRDSSFQRQVPQIKSERERALALLHLPTTEAMVDTNLFNAAYKKVTDKPEIPDSFIKSTGTTTLTVQPMSDYLSNLEQKLSTKR